MTDPETCHANIITQARETGSSILRRMYQDRAAELKGGDA
jgi:hypothetical protein